MSAAETRPHVVGQLGSDGQWRVLLMVPAPGACMLETAISPDLAEVLARELLEYAALVRDRIGLPGGEVMP